MNAETKKATTELVERIIGPDERFVHDRQTTWCNCHDKNQLYEAVTQRNRLRSDMRYQMVQEMAKL